MHSVKTRSHPDGTGMIDMCVIVRQQVGGETLLRRHLVVAVNRRFDVCSGEKLTGFYRHLAHMMVGVQLGGFGWVIVEAEEVHGVDDTASVADCQQPCRRLIVLAPLSPTCRGRAIARSPP